MSRALDFQIRYGNADELDNYDPMGDVYNNQAAIGGVQHLIFQSPLFDEASEQTYLIDELGEDRARVGNNCLLGDGTTTIDLSDGVAGTLSLSGWVNDGGGWSYTTITGGLSGTTLTPVSGYYYKNLERYDNGVLVDVMLCEESTGRALISTEGNSAYISASGLRATQNEAPLSQYSGDSIGYNFNPILYNSSNWSSGGQFGASRLHKLPLNYTGVDTNIYFDQNNPSGGFNDWDVAYTASGLEVNPSNVLSGNSFFYLFIEQTTIPITNIPKGALVRCVFDLYFPPSSNYNRAWVDLKNNGLVYQNGFYFFPNANIQTIENIVIWGENGTDTDFRITLWANSGYDPATDAKVHIKNYRLEVLNTYLPTKDGVNDSLFGYELSNTGRKMFNSYRINNEGAYFDTHSYLTPVSGSVVGRTITDTYGTAQWTVSGNNIACTASGSCNGIKLDNGNWYTFNEGIFGNGSNYVYDVSGSGVHLEINGQTASGTWQQVAGQTNYGYDWQSIYGGHRYRDTLSANDIFIPHIVNTQDVPTESLLPSGYTLLTDFANGKHVFNGSTWLLASGLYGEINNYDVYRAELDAHQMNVTSFTESSGHYIRQQGNRWDRLVMYPKSLSPAANTLVDFNAQGIENVVGLTFKVTDVHNLNQVNASYSKKFRLPATQRNNDLFDYVYDPNSADFSTLKEPKDCEIISNGIEILRGKGQVEKTFKKDIATGYDMTVIGDNYNIYTALDDIMVSGLDFGTFTLSQANVEDSWNYTAASGNVVFAPIDWGNKNFNSFDLADITPSFFIKNILQKGFASAGIGYESEWLDSDYASRLVMPFNGFWSLSDADYATVSGYALFEAEDASLAITASGVSTKVYLPITETTANPNYTASGGYVAANPAKMKIKFGFDDLTYDNANIDALANGKVGAALFGCTFGIEMNGQDIAEQTIGGEALEIDTSNIATQGGDVIRVYFKGIEDVTLTNAYFKSEIRRDITEDLTLTLSEYVPVSKDGLTVFDVFKGIADIFNIIAYYDPFSKLLKFEPYNDFYNGELNWSEKWNQTQEAQNTYLGDNLNREILHKYKDDETDFKLTKFGNQNEDIEPYGSYLLELPRNYKKGRRTIENHLFAATVDYDLSQFGLSIPNIQWNTKDGTQYSGGRSGMIPTNRILYYEGKNAAGNFKMNVGAGFQYSVQEYAYLPRLVFRARSGDTWQSLAMDTFDGKNGAFRTYFEPKYRNIWNGITSIYWLNLNERDIALRPLDKKIYLDGAWWLINQIIDFNPLNDEPTQVELIKLVNYTFDIPANNTPWIDIISGKKFDPVTHKPNNDLPSNGGFDVTQVSGENIKPVDDDYYGVGFGQGNQAPNKSNSVQFGEGLKTYWSNQYQFGKYNETNSDAIFQVGGGTSASGRATAFEVVREQGQFSLNVGGDRVINDGWHITTSGVKRSSYKQLTGSGTLAGDGTLTIYPTHDATSSGTAIFNEITFASAMVINLNGGGGNADLHFNTLSTSQIDIYATSSHAYDIIYKIEGN